ncbi:helix-turn-helix domain-containing protein [Nocardiopsis mangrovi]|uniref:Helix-turn-helix domain-containing protein n=1 Tax=Nocardiopsis mangrovi TaxID=1179818 RepID=A0ABV9DUR9_9ACTN
MNSLKIRGHVLNTGFMSTFGEALRAQIELSGMNQTQLANACGWSRSQISALVTGARLPKGDAVEALDEALGAQGVLMRKWVEERRRATQPDWMRRIANVEDKATEIRISQPTILPAVLQPPTYASALYRIGKPSMSEDEISSAVSRRMERGHALLRPGGPLITAVLSESVVRAANDIDPDSLSHLLELPQSVCVQLLPDGVYLGAAVGAFRLISFADRLPVVFLEHAMGGVIVDHEDSVVMFSASANRLQACAMSPDDSAKRIKEIANE